jgi:hypothetical protein
MRSRLLSVTVLVVLAMAVMVSAQGRKTKTEVFSIRAKAFDQQGYKLNFVMPPNWLGPGSDVQIFGYYGENGEFQDVVVPVSIKDDFGLNLLIEFPESVRTHPNGMTLHHIDVEIRTTGERATSGFGFKQLAK